MMASMKGKPVRAFVERQNIQDDRKCFAGRLNYQENSSNSIISLRFIHLKILLRPQYLSPCSQIFRVGVPIHLGTHRVALHLVKVRDTHTSGVEELSPQKLAMEGDWRI